MSAWACGQSDTWSQLKRGFKGLSVEFATLSDKAATQVNEEKNEIFVPSLAVYMEWVRL